MVAPRVWSACIPCRRGTSATRLGARKRRPLTLTRRNLAQNEDSDLRRFLRGQGGDGYTSRGTGDEGLPSTPPPPLRGALGYGARGHEVGGVGGGSPVAAASLRFGHALACHPLRTRMVVGGGAYALTDLLAGALRGAAFAWLQPHRLSPSPWAWVGPEPAVQSCVEHGGPRSAASDTHVPSSVCLTCCSHSLTPPGPRWSGWGGRLPRGKNGLLAAGFASLRAAPADPRCILRRSRHRRHHRPRGRAHPLARGTWCDGGGCGRTERRRRRDASSVVGGLGQALCARAALGAGALSPVPRAFLGERVSEVWGPQVVVGAAVMAPLLRGADAVLLSLLPYNHSQVRGSTNRR